MQKVYLLLRNNQQTGPYGLEEIIQLELKPFDLVWVEGHSAAWQYPGEINSLQPFVHYNQPSPSQPGSPETGGRHIYVRMPVKKTNPYPILPQIEELPTPSTLLHERYMPKSSGQPVEKPHPPLSNNYQEEPSTFQPRETALNYPSAPKKKTSLPGRDAGIILTILILIAGGYYLMTRPVSVSPAASLPGAASTNETVHEESTGTGTPDVSEIQPVTNEKKSPVQALNTTVKKPEKKNQKKLNPSTPDAAITTGTVEETMVLEKASLPSSPQTASEEVEKPGTVITPSSSKKEKKKLGAVVKNIFGKKEKKTETEDAPVVMEEPRHTTDRKSVKRETGEGKEKTTPVISSEEAMTTLASSIDLSTNEPDNWMMGISGLKITLRNRNEVSLQKVAVEVQYYDGSNKLLEKKTVYFNSIPAKGTKTLAAPDHKFADHVQVKLGTISVKDDRYAKD